MLTSDLFATLLNDVPPREPFALTDRSQDDQCPSCVESGRPFLMFDCVDDSPRCPNYFE